MDKFRAQAEAFGARIVTDDARTIVPDGDAWIVKGGERAITGARAVIVATGAAYRRLGLPRRGAPRRQGRVLLRHVRRRRSSATARSPWWAAATRP